MTGGEDLVTALAGFERASRGSDINRWNVYGIRCRKKFAQLGFAERA
jgi:hypothetical protein